MKTAPWIIIAVLLTLLFLQRECAHVPDCPEQEPCTLQHCDTTQGDSIPYPVISYVPQITFRDTGSWHYYLVDTNAIVADYLTKYFVADTLLSDTNAFIAVYDSLYMNRIIWRKPVITLKPIIVRKTNTVTLAAKPRNKLFVGIGVGRNMNNFGLAPSLMLISKKEHAYSLSYDLMNKDVYFTFYYKISFKKAR